MLRHWREAAIEAAGAALILATAALTATLLELAVVLPQAAWLKRVLLGTVIGGVIYALVHSAWGRRSGAHFNPAVTLAFLRLGRVPRRSALAYVAAHVIGASLGLLLMLLCLGALLGPARVPLLTTRPGAWGAGAAFATELVLSFVLMFTILTGLASPRFERHTGVAAAVLVALFIGVAGSVSGPSMNPARTFAADLVFAQWSGFWIYLLAPPIGMLAAAELHRRRTRGGAATHVAARCAKLSHADAAACHFCAWRRREP